ncbi:MAG: hypothetical protein HY056_10055 [Proteobacteria bacterium]|nr:hypothetical protein [Pseudomonadota bacterium]
MTSLFSNLDGLLQLARYDGVDIRPTLLRVLTDLYVQKPGHSRDEERHYTELALRLIEAVDVPIRKTIADRLTRYPAAPLIVLRRLADDIGEFARIERRRAATIHQTSVLQATGAGPPRQSNRLAASVRTAAALPAKTAASVSDAALPAAPAIAAPTAAIPTANSGRTQSTATRGTDTATATANIGDAFFAAEPSERRVILGNLAFANGPAPPLRPLTAEDLTRLESAALGGRPDLFIREIEAALGVSRQLAERIVNDPTGEPTIVAAKALAIPLDVLQRVLMFLNPAVGHSVERLYSLSALYHDIRRDAALRLVVNWRAAPGRPAPTPRHQPLHWDDERKDARSMATPAPRPARRDATPGVRPAPTRQPTTDSRK